jgi:hypothetical protein
MIMAKKIRPLAIAKAIGHLLCLCKSDVNFMASILMKDFPSPKRTWEWRRLMVP